MQEVHVDIEVVESRSSKATWNRVSQLSVKDFHGQEKGSLSFEAVWSQPNSDAGALEVCELL